MVNRVLACACCVLLLSAPAAGQSSSQPETGLQPLEQHPLIERAKQDFAAAHWPDAYAEFTELHKESPDDAKITEYLAEAALNVDKDDLAIALLQPIRKAQPARWMVSALLARAYAETNRDAERDAELANLKQMHDTKFAPKIAELQWVLLEQRSASTGSVRIWYALEPVGRFKAYIQAKVFDASGAEVYHLTLDSSDVEQALWAKTHVAEAAAGERVFFLDGYSRPQKNANGTSSSMQALLGIYDGKPAYDVIRDRIVSIAVGRQGLAHAGAGKLD